jgi:hypothetical protein
MFKGKPTHHTANIDEPSGAFVLNKKIETGVKTEDELIQYVTLG